jgi:DNA-binding transcriptional LysR family regulator
LCYPYHEFSWDLIVDFDDRVLQRIKLSDLRLLQAVVKWGGMARAAAQLHISQPAVSKAIKALEQTLGVRLLDRTPQGVEPTIYGQALLNGGAAAFDDLKQSVRQIEFLADPFTGELRIGCTEAGAAGFVPSIIARLSTQYPRVTFSVVTGDAARFVERDLPQRDIDLAIGALPDAAGSNTEITSAVLFEDHHFVMAGVQNKWVRRRKIALADLMAEPWILPPPDSTMGQYIARAFRAQGLEPPRSRVVSFSIPLCHHLLASHDFLTVHPLVMTELGKHLNLRRLNVQLPGISRSIGIMTLKNRTLNPLARLFISSAHEMAKAFIHTGNRRKK